MASFILLTKLSIPQDRPRQVTRSRLGALLEASLELPLTLVSAPAGFGKSTLVSQWIRTNAGLPHLAERTAWVSLEAEDDDPARFWEYLFAAIEMLKLGAIHFETARSLLQGHPAPSTQFILTDVINQLSRQSTEVLLVLDDFHVIHAPAILEGIAFLIEHLPPSVHLILITRSDPPLPLGRWRGRGCLAEIRAAHLRFTLDEATAYLNQAQTLSLDEAAIRSLEQRTEGWIAGLQMAALSLRDREPAAAAQFIAGFSGQHHLILDYLTDEVLHRQPEPIQAFLLKTSILSRLCPALCAAVVAGPDSPPSGGFAQLLEALEHANLFIIPLDDQRVWYRYHHLFGELLQVRLKERHPEWMSALHRQAAGWYETNGYPFEAMQHALAAEDLTLATEVIERTVRQPSTWSTGSINRMLDTVQALPPAIVAARPWLRVYLSGIIYVGGQLEIADRMLAGVEESLPALAVPAEARAELSLYLDAFLGFYAATRGEGDTAIARAQRVLARVDEEDRRVYGHALATLAQAAFSAGDVAQAARLYRQAVDNQMRKQARFTAVTWSSNLADVLTAQGRLHEAARLCQETVELGTIQGNPGPAVGYTQSYAAAIWYEWNQLEAAESALLAGLHLLQNSGISPNFGRAHATLGMIQQALGRPAEARVSLEIASQLAARSGAQRYQDRVAACQARLWLAQGELAQAQAWAEQVVRQPAAPYLREFEDLTLALIRYREARLSEALAIVDSALAGAEAAGRGGAVIEALALRSLVRAEQTDGQADSVAALQRALRLSLPEQYQRTYLDLGGPMEERLRSLACADSSLADYRDALLRSFQTGAPAQPAEPLPDQVSLMEKLSGRELEILRLIAAGLSNGEIARRLYLTLNTIRAHSSHIFGKLGVHSRTEAVARAREFGLLK